MIKKGEIISCLDIKEKIPYDFVIYGLQRGEIGLLYGQGGIGKGFFLKHFFTNKNNLLYEKPINILYLSLEDDYVSISNVFNNLEIVHNNVHFGFDLETEKYWKLYDLVIIDTWSRYLRGEYDENSSKEMGQAYEQLINKAKNYNCAFLIVAHTNKGGRNKDKERSINDLRGSSLLSDNARLVVALSNDKDENKLICKTVKINRKKIKEQKFRRTNTGDLEIISDNSYKGRNYE